MQMTIAAEATAAGSVGSSAQCRQEIFAGDGFAREIHLALPPLRRYALALTRNTSAAEDLVQDALVRGMEKIHLWQPGTDLRAWLFALLRNLYVNGVRRAVREAVMVERIGAKASFACPPSQTKWLELRDLQRGLSKLPEEQRSAVLLIGFEGREYATAASRLGIPIGTVRSRVSRGRTSLRVLTDQGSAPRARSRPSRNRVAA
jgi:RNA polymerase sigma-70 factor, ECF subfamily